MGIDAESAWDRQPVWRFSELDAKHPESAAKLTAEDYRAVHEKLAQYETLLCRVIWGEASNGCHRYDVDAAHENIKKRLVEIEKDDTTAVHSLRLTGAFRVHGILREHIFHLLWIDRNHELWPSKKRNT